MASTAEDNPPQTVTPGVNTTEQYLRDETFYDDAIVLKVENVNFRVSRILLGRGSEVFTTMLSLPQGEHADQTSTEGACDACPIALPGVTADEFRGFLEILYTNLAEIDKPAGIVNVTPDWRSTLKLATLWEFESVRKYAIRALRAEQPVERIVLAKMYDIKGWIEDALYALVHRDEPLILEDFDALGLDMSIRVIRLREKVLKHPNRMLERPGEWHRCVGDVFGAEFVQDLKREWDTSYY